MLVPPLEGLQSAVEVSVIEELLTELHQLLAGVEVAMDGERRGRSGEGVVGELGGVLPELLALGAVAHFEYLSERTNCPIELR